MGREPPRMLHHIGGRHGRPRLVFVLTFALIDVVHSSSDPSAHDQGLQPPGWSHLIPAGPRSECTSPRGGGRRRPVARLLDHAGDHMSRWSRSRLSQISAGRRRARRRGRCSSGLDAAEPVALALEGQLGTGHPRAVEGGGERLGLSSGGTTGSFCPCSSSTGQSISSTRASGSRRAAVGPASHLAYCGLEVVRRLQQRPPASVTPGDGDPPPRTRRRPRAGRQHRPAPRAPAPDRDPVGVGVAGEGQATPPPRSRRRRRPRPTGRSSFSR